MMAFQPGEILDGRFEIAELIHRSDRASIFKTIDQKTGSAAAVKIPCFEPDSDAASYSRFRHEIEIGRKLNHPGIPKVFAVDNPSRPYLAMEYLDGETLGSLLHRVRPLPPGDARRIAALACDALEYMHGQNVVHRDLKPTNVMLCVDGSLRIMNVGVAPACAHRRLTFAAFSNRLGLPYYLAPEQVRGQRGDARTDLYGIGAILYEMATGHAPFDEQQDLFSIMNARLVADPVAPRVHNPNVTPALEAVIRRALARDVDDRYQSAAAMMRDLIASDTLAPATGTPLMTGFVPRANDEMHV